MKIKKKTIDQILPFGPVIVFFALLAAYANTANAANTNDGSAQVQCIKGRILSTSIPSDEELAKSQEAAAKLKEAGILFEHEFTELRRGFLRGLKERVESVKRGDIKHALRSNNPWTELMNERIDRLTYFEDTDGKIYVSKSKPDLSQASSGILIKNTNPDSEVQILAPREVGEIKYNHEKKTWKFDVHHAFAKTHDEHAELLKKLEDSLPEGHTIETSTLPTNSLTKDQILSCGKLTGVNTSKINFMATTIAVDLAAQGATMAMMGQFKTPEGQASAIARLGWVAFMDTQSKLLDMFIIDKAKGMLMQIAKPMAVKIPLLIYVDRPLNEKWNEAVMGWYLDRDQDDSKKQNKKKSEHDQLVANAIADANLEAQIGRMPITTLIDVFLLKNLAPLTMKLCQVSPKLTFVVNNQSVRFVERAAVSSFSSWYVTRRTKSIVEEKQSSSDSGSSAPIQIHAH
jgi:hypothetical protein